MKSIVYTKNKNTTQHSSLQSPSWYPPFQTIDSFIRNTHSSASDMADQFSDSASTSTSSTPVCPPTTVSTGDGAGVHTAVDPHRLVINAAVHELKAEFGAIGMAVASIVTTVTHEIMTLRDENRALERKVAKLDSMLMMLATSLVHAEQYGRPIANPVRGANDGAP